MKKIFLTGITGLVGSAFAVALLRERKDYEIVCLARPGNGKNAAERAYTGFDKTHNKSS